MTCRAVLLASAVAVLTACDSTPGINPYAECLTVFVIEPQHIQLVRGDSTLFSARRVAFCDQLRTGVDWKMQDTLVATFRALSDSTAMIVGADSGSTVLTVVDRADTLHRAGVTIIVTR